MQIWEVISRDMICYQDTQWLITLSSSYPALVSGCLSSYPSAGTQRSTSNIRVKHSAWNTGRSQLPLPDRASRTGALPYLRCSSGPPPISFRLNRPHSPQTFFNFISSNKDYYGEFYVSTWFSQLFNQTRMEVLLWRYFVDTLDICNQWT